MTAVAFGALVGCSSDDLPVGPTPTREKAVPRLAKVDDATARESNAPAAAQGIPRAVFKTTPPDQDGILAGQTPFSVQFNLCQSRPTSDDDDLRYTYDFDGDGTIDARGACRASHVYETSEPARTCRPARVCVSDRRPGGEVCHSYDVCVDGGPETPGPTTPGTGAPGNTFAGVGLPLPIRDGSTVSSTAMASGVGTIENVTVSLHLTHAFAGDIDMFLVAPDGTQVTLSEDNGAGGENYGVSCSARTILDRAADAPIQAVPAPFLGTFRPAGDLGIFVGKSGAAANGPWTLVVRDDAALDEGVLLCWDLTITSLR